MKRKRRPVLDASAALAIIQDEPGSEALRQVLPEAVIGAVNAAEVLAKLIREGVPVRDAIAALRALHVPAVAFDPGDAERSARYVAKGVSLGDRCFLATALQGEGWTSDRELVRLVHGPPPLRYFR